MAMMAPPSSLWQTSDTATPCPQPISRSRSSGSTPKVCTAHTSRSAASGRFIARLPCPSASPMSLPPIDQPPPALGDDLYIPVHHLDGHLVVDGVQRIMQLRSPLHHLHVRHRKIIRVEVRAEHHVPVGVQTGSRSTPSTSRPPSGR